MTEFDDRLDAAIVERTRALHACRNLSKILRSWGQDTTDLDAQADAVEAGIPGSPERQAEALRRAG